MAAVRGGRRALASADVCVQSDIVPNSGLHLVPDSGLQVRDGAAFMLIGENFADEVSVWKDVSTDPTTVQVGGHDSPITPP